jgi:DNA invertase Pin-like site-specific DNA recombinase
MTANHWSRQKRPNKLIEEMLKAGESVEDIVLELGVHHHTVRRLQKDLGIKGKDGRNRRGRPS